jgi:hypothetical protein
VLILKAAISNYTGGFIDALPTLAGVAGVNTANRKAYFDANIISNLTAADSLTIVNHVKDPIAVDIPDSVDLLENKKSLLEVAGVTDVVVASLKLLKYDHDTLSAALEMKAAEESYLDVATAMETIDDAIQNAIDLFSS